MKEYMGFLAGCSTTAAVGLGLLLLTGATNANKARFDEITVGRINIEEPDGTKRLIISNRAQFPGSFLQGKEYPRPDRRDFAGMLFVNDEGTENGGLVQKGSIVNGVADAGLSLTFDRFRQDQGLQLLHTDVGKRSSSGLIVNDVPDPDVMPMMDVPQTMNELAKLPPAQRQAAYERLLQDGKVSTRRVYLGTRDRVSTLSLNDANGKPRMKLMVTAQGQPVIEMYDATGKVVKSVVP